MSTYINLSIELSELRLLIIRTREKEKLRIQIRWLIQDNREESEKGILTCSVPDARSKNRKCSDTIAHSHH